MNFKIDDLEVMFPYKHIYPEQYSYMKELKRALDANGHCLLEMPSGTGKTIALLSLIVAYKRKLIYCSRTVPEIDKALSELKRLYQYRKDDHFLGLGLSSRRNLCINDSVANANGALVDARCRNLTSSWAQQRCDFFEALSDPTIDPGVYTLDDIKDYGKQKGQCPYYLARKLVCLLNLDCPRRRCHL
jgi:DNA excision repair protein ERCC-2